jgi:hypothetical protein
MPMATTRLLASSRFFIPLPLFPDNPRQCRQAVLRTTETESEVQSQIFKRQKNAIIQILLISNATDTTTDRTTSLQLSRYPGQRYWRRRKAKRGGQRCLSRDTEHSIVHHLSKPAEAWRVLVSLFEGIVHSVVHVLLSARCPTVLGVVPVINKSAA